MRKDRRAAPRSASARSRSRSLPGLEALNGRDPGLTAEGWFTHRAQVYPYGSQCRRGAGRPRTGGVAVERYCIAYDIGRAINPALVEGQIVGGFARASAARCSRSSPTASAAIRSPSPSPII
jgi:CO/xanthine dehydrogenase Mo-binding subunit